MSAPLGYAALCEMARELARPQGTLTVLSHGADPFGVGTPAHIAHAEWFARLWNEHMGHGGHLRRLHYRLVSQPAPVAMVDGRSYENTLSCWAALKAAGKWARYLGLIDADDIDDRRNPRPHVHLREDEAIEPPTVQVSEPEYYEATPPFIRVPKLPDLPRLTLDQPAWRPRMPQRYHVEIWVEKSDVEDIVLPIARTYGLNYCPFLGQPGIKPCRDLVVRAERSERPVRVLYISDFDPQGESMPIAVARKIEFILAERGLDLDIQVIPLALTKQQCVELKLPRIPIKDSDSGKGRFEERHGEGATELDALEAVVPGRLRQFIMAEVGRYYDATLDDRAEAAFDDAFQQLSEEVSDLNDSVVPRYDDDLAELRAGLAITEALKPIHEQLKPIQEQARAWRRRVEQVYQAIAAELENAAPPPDDILDLPEPAEGDEHLEPLFDSRRSYLDQIAVYKAHQGRPTEKRERRDKGRRRKPNGEAAP